MFFSKRFFSFFLLLVSFGVFASAKPIDSHDVAVRELGDVTTNNVNGLTRRHHHENPRGSPTDLLGALTDLQNECNPLIAQLDGTGDLVSICAQIIAKIDASTIIIGGLGSDGCINLTVCITIIVTIIVNICTGVLLYPPILVAQVSGLLNTCITAWVKVIIKICPGILGGLVAALLLDIALLL